ncbi:hypothetical protein SKAU_G00246100 [Synaphobranchus kaupii]|uniref:Gypsy retrotransposon integrase-like protein 1 n=1 Tax=Synaphobranchus kaupii TaxID=118154 RepID=A0A9Q1F273_SYNKA|nr:hypothetical protein SKAU_G00246100 [Synaphobranchus kaupii]
MERALLREIGELERSIGELTRREARRAGAVTSPEWQTPAVRVSRRPDGFSARQDNPTSTAGHLALALEGPALEAILDLPPAERQNLQALTAALQRRFIQHRSAEASREKLLSRYQCEEESWGKVDVPARPTMQKRREREEKLALHAFLEALIKTTRAEDTLAIRPTPQPTRQHVRVADDKEVRWTRTPLQRPAGRQGRCYQCDEPGHIARDCPAPAPKPRKPPPREPTLLNQVHTPVPKPSPALPAPVAKIPATSAEASTSAFEKATERKSHPRVGRLGKASGLYLHCRLDGQACRALVDTGATISLVRPGVLHNTGGPQLPGAWTPTATPLTSVTGAKMAMSGQEGQHHPWHRDCSPPIRPDTKTGPTSPPSSHHSPASKQATPASHRTQATVTDHSAPARPLARPPQPACNTATACRAQTSSACRDDSSCVRGADLFAVRDEDCTQTELVQHTINTDTAQPICLRPHRMSPAKRLVAEEKVKEMAAPAVLVQKKSGEWRFCVDYRRLNSATTKDSYPLPRIDEALDHISGSSWFSLLDLRSGYWQEGQSMAFDQLRAALTEAPVLAYPDAQRPFIIDTDTLRGKLLAGWRGYDFEIRHRAGRLHENADALSRRPCAAQECRYCSRQEEWDQVSPDVVVVQASGDAEGWLPLMPMELREAQEADSTLGKMRGWLEAGQRPERSVMVAGSRPGSDILQLLVPRALRPDVLRLVHGLVGAGHFGNNKTLHRLRGKFHWLGCRHDVELHIHCVCMYEAKMRIGLLT